MAQRKIDRKAYRFYVYNPRTGKLVSGWEYREDARDFVRETDNPGLKVYTRSYVERLGADPTKNNSWYGELGAYSAKNNSGNGKLGAMKPTIKKYKTIPEVVLSGDFRKDIQIPEIKIRYNRGKTFGRISSSKDVYEFLLRVYGRAISLQEHFVLLLTDNNLNILGYYKHTIGTPVSTLADIPMIMSIVLKTMARSFIVSHNHPSGNTSPSEADRRLTKQIRAAAEKLNLSLLDHLIVTREGYFSFADQGELSGLGNVGKTKKTENIETELREAILEQLKKVQAKPELTPSVHRIIQSEKGYRWLENRIIQLMISDGLTPSATIPQIEAEL